LHLAGMWVAFAGAAGAIVYFVHHLTMALADRERELAAARDLAARREKLGALATLAAGAAHELATPLATIALVSEELAGSFPSGDVKDDLVLLQTQVRRCRTILDQMVAEAGQLTGERLARVCLSECAAAACEQLNENER